MALGTALCHRHANGTPMALALSGRLVRPAAGGAQLPAHMPCTYVPSERSERGTSSGAGGRCRDRGDRNR